MPVTQEDLKQAKEFAEAAWQEYFDAREAQDRAIAQARAAHEAPVDAAARKWNRARDERRALEQNWREQGGTEQ